MHQNPPPHIGAPSWEGQPIPTSSLWSSSRAKGRAHTPITRLHVSTPRPTPPPLQPPLDSHLRLQRPELALLQLLDAGAQRREVGHHGPQLGCLLHQTVLGLCRQRAAQQGAGGTCWGREGQGQCDTWGLRCGCSPIPGRCALTFNAFITICRRAEYLKGKAQDEMSPLQPGGSRTSPTTWGPPKPHLFLTLPSEHCLQRTPWRGAVCGGQACGTRGSKHCYGGSRAHGGSSSLGSRSCSSMGPRHRHPMGRRGCGAGGAPIARVPSAPRKRVPPGGAGRLAGSQPAPAASPCSRQCLLSTRTPCPS